MRRSRIIFGLGLALGIGQAATGARAEGPTYHKDVAAILRENCQECHRPGQVAPFALLTYDQARKRAADIVEVTGEKVMPPWPASTSYGGPFRDERVLADAEVATLREWLEAGCPEGYPKDALPPKVFSSDWPLGEPDLVLTMGEAYELEASGDDEFRVFVLPTSLPADRWIRAVDFKPGNRRVVHHVLAGVAREKEGRWRELDAKDPKPGYSSLGGFGDGVQVNGFLPIWTPGSRPRYTPEGSGYFLPAGADVLIQMHYHKSGKVEADATSIGLYLSETPLPKRVETGFLFPSPSPMALARAMVKAKLAEKAGRRPRLNELMRDVLTIPPGEANYEVKGSSRSGRGGGPGGRPLSRDILLTSVMPHMHWLGKDFTFTAVLPDEEGTRIPLIRIDRWNFNWQGTYAFAEPIRLPRGAWLEMEAHFDNTAENPVNPHSPPKVVSWGDQTTDEMCIGIFEFVAADEGESRPKPDKDGAPPARVEKKDEARP